MHKLDVLVEMLNEAGMKIAVETQGTIWQDWLLACKCVTLSPKAPSSGETTDWEKLDKIVSRLPPAIANLKVVVFDDTDYNYAAEVHKRYSAVPFYLQVGTAPSNPLETTVATRNQICNQLEWLGKKALEDSSMSDAVVLPQMHVLMWGHKLGV